MAESSSTQGRRRDLPSLLGIRGLAAREAATAYLLIAPIYLFFSVFVFVPMFLAFYISLTRWDGIGTIDEAQFVGLRNYANMFGDERFLWSLFHDIEFALETFVGEILIGLALALIVNRARRLVGITRLFVFSPVILPTAAVAILFARLLMNPTYGTFNYLLDLVGIPPSMWIYHPDSAMRAVVLTTIWKAAGYYMILFLAALQGIPQEFYDAGHIDGAGPWDSFWHITLPLLKPALLFICVINLISNLQAFTQIWVMTAGGPNRATEVVVVLIYNTAFSMFKLSYASAIAVVLFVIILSLTLFQVRVMRRGGYQEY